MINNSQVFILIFIFIFIFIFYMLFLYEEFNNDNIKLYVIHLEISTDRINNITNQQKKTKLIINNFNAVDANNLDKQKLIDQGILSPDYASYSNKGHYACFLSHRNILKKIALSNLTGYSIIFEDDFNIIDNNFDNNIKNIINNLESINYDFDMIFLGNYNVDEKNNENNIINNIYTIKHDSNVTAEGYIVNNKSANKIYNLLSYIDSPVDFIFQKIRNNDSIKALVIFPYLVTQNRKLESLIG